MVAQIAVFVSGGGSNLQALLDHFGSRAEKGRIALVVSNRAEAGALERARRHSIASAVVTPEDSDGILSVLAAHGIDLIALAGYLRRIPADVVAAYPRRIVNVHPGPLPEFGGAGMYGERVHAAVLASGRAESAVSIHYVDDEYDRGPLIARYPVAVVKGDTPATLGARTLAREHEVFARVLEDVIESEIHSSAPVP